MVTHPKLIGRQGNIAQLGGDFIFGVGGYRVRTDLALRYRYHPIGPQCSFAHRMRHTEDRKLMGDIDTVDVRF